MVLASHGHHAPLAEVRQACGVSRDGVNALAMLRAAESYGLVARGYSAELDDLAGLPLPAILHWDFRHFVVLEKLERDGSARIVDPAQGRLRISAAHLGKAFTGAVLAFQPTAALRERARRAPDLRRYRQLLHENSGTLARLVVFSLVLQFCGMAFPFGQQLLVDRVLAPGGDDWPGMLALALGLAVLVQTLLQWARGRTLDLLHARLDLRLLGDFMAHVVRLPIQFFHQRSPGDLLQRLQSNEHLRTLLGSQAASAALDVFLVLGYGALMFHYHWKLALLVVAVGGVRAAIQLGLRGLSRQVAAAEQVALSGAGSTLVESLGALETIRAVAAESTALRRWSDRVVQRANAGLPRLQLENGAAQATALLNALGVAVVSACAGFEVIAGSMSLGVFTAFLTLQALYLVPFNSLIASLEQWQFLNSCLARLEDVMEAEPESASGLDAATLRGEIGLEHVSCRYAPSSPWVMRDVNVHIGAGEKIAIVGPSGAGKTTLARVLLGLVRPTAGNVRFDGIEIGRYHPARLRARLGAVLQEVQIVNDTVAANIALSDPALDADRIRAAAERACLDGVIAALPQGYATRLGEDGRQLSGGERQRLCLARALAAAPAVLVLDEATSALDTETERRLHANLADLGCTRIVIAHRLATVRDADRILVMDRGRIVQQGRYAQLCVQPGLFRDLAKSLEGGDD